MLPIWFLFTNSILNLKLQILEEIIKLIFAQSQIFYVCTSQYVDGFQANKVTVLRI